MNRDWNPFEEAAAPPESVRVFGIELRVGDRVRINPKKKADILDMALAGKIAVIEAIEQDFEDHVQLAFGAGRRPGPGVRHDAPARTPLLLLSR